MKKILSAFLVTAIAGTAFASAPTALAKTTTYILGDTNKDGVVSIFDVTEIQRVLAELNVSDKEYVKLSGDVNKDGLDIKDATEIQKYLAEFKTPYPIGGEVGGGVISGIKVTTEVEGTAEYMTVDWWSIRTSDDVYFYAADTNSMRYDDAGNSFTKDGYIKSHIEYVDENGKPDASKVTVFFDEKPNPNATVKRIVAESKSARLTDAEDAMELSTAWQNGKYTFNLPRVEASGSYQNGKYTFDFSKVTEPTITAKVTWQGVYSDYTVSVYKDGKAVGTKSVSGTECTFDGLSARSYEARVSANGYEQTLPFTVEAEVVNNDDGHDFKLVQTERTEQYFCNCCGCWVDGSVKDHLITESDWQKVKAEAATYEQTSKGSYYNYPRYHKQYFIKGMKNQEMIDSTYYQNKTGNYTIWLKPWEEGPIDSATEKPYLNGRVNEEEKLLWGGECGLILISDEEKYNMTDQSKFIQDTIALNPVFGEKKFVGKIDPNQNRYLFDENGEVLRDEEGNPIRNAIYKTVLKEDFTVEDILNMDFTSYHNFTQGCPSGYHSEWVDVITDYTDVTAPSTCYVKLTVK